MNIKIWETIIEMKSKRNKFKKFKEKLGKINSESLSSKDNSLQEKESNYSKTFIEFRNLLLEYETKIIRLKEQNAILNSEKESLTKSIKEYETLYKEWATEKKNLVLSHQKAVLQAENCKNTMSFRLGYALIFGFKSWNGFKHLLKTLFTLRKDKKIKNIPQIESTLPQIEKKEISWDSSKPILQWTKNIDFNYLTEFNKYQLSPNDEILEINHNGFSKIIDCIPNTQLIIKLNTFSLDKPDLGKQVLLTIVFYDKEGKQTQSKIDIPYSERLNKYYFYLNTNRKLDDYITLLVPPDVCRVELGTHLWDAESTIYLNNQIEVSTLVDGVTVILPTYKGEKTILKCLTSLAEQTLPYSKFEVLIIINGEKDNTPKLIDRFKANYPQLDIKVYELNEGNVSKARNYGIQQATKTFTTFIDDDDFVPSNYLYSLYQRAMFNTITITGIEDIENGQVIRSPIMDQLDKAFKKNSYSYFDVTSTLTMNACKLAPSFMVKATQYDFNLRSGEDVVYWCNLLNTFRPNVALISTYEKDSYKRLIRSNSISRKAESYDFNVLQRLEVIKHLILDLKDSQYKNIDIFLQSKINAQANFIKNYLEKYPSDYAMFLQDIARMDLHNAFIGTVNSLFTDTLVISYCYAPYIDTSGVVMSKRIRAMEKPVDIITNSMNKVRETDEKLLKIAEYYVGKHIELNAPQSFANANAILKFVDLALDATHQLIKSRKIYRNLYSRAMWPASHIAAATIKMKYPQMKWIAEFSDPILVDVSGKERYEELDSNWLKKQGFVSEDIYLSDKQNLFYWCEKLAYLYADELIFTNKNQLDYMLSYADEELRDVIRNKAIILPQPTLPREFYNLSVASLEKEPNIFHLAYFGSFYVNRGFKPFIEAWNKLQDSYKKRLKLYIYTQQDPESILNEVPNDLRHQIIIQKYVGYFDFLALSDQFDGLIVMDAETKGLKMNNPYLPSKLSDYLGSQSQILALIEEGSPISNIEHSRLFKADMNKIDEINSIMFSFLSNSSHRK
ncbi:hypothetical protein AM305_11510 [Actinobacillus minor NM305]|uniref:Glycosyltransferase 2-like domain-containing protein n=1 Tax=Actinobacillus minor NM305 TaxID=637911 RepID=C5S348_9PAST|nr:glycosyltransferase [Actinobacillus minor]EER46677.1 hypothetical protein AM305_11510 [Actinobacillus minor NM305]